ncbi:type II toxin-antitoxin system HicB family antitoxin [Pseudomonas chlororaphis]|uniref:type II toxin-antitoxin system HicB family antitoxin n=1 Tax=Pseudomonas chlororaphis TaxID=587753 RepID=UPI0006910FC9|nr:antitoxin [Pseudomonas chlororaphis]
MYQYPIKQHAEPDGVRLSCPDIPEMNAVGETQAQALVRAVNGMKSALALYVLQRREIPPASVAAAPALVLYLPVVIVAKIMLWNAMYEHGMSCADLARRMDCTRTESIRLVNFFHPSKICTLERALDVLGRRLALMSEAVVVGDHQSKSPHIKGR